jgi:hypothetical protein
MFQLSTAEADSAQALRSQIAISSPKGRGGRRSRPYAFTEQGVAMLSSFLRSKKAVEVNIAIMGTFVLCGVPEILQHRSVLLFLNKPRFARDAIGIRGPLFQLLRFSSVTEASSAPSSRLEFEKDFSRPESNYFRDTTLAPSSHGFEQAPRSKDRVP